MQIAQYVLLGLAPGLLWLWFFRRKDDFEPEPRIMVLRVFALGGLAALGILAIGPSLNQLLPREPGILREIVDNFALVAFPEEVAKALAFVVGAYFSRELDEPLDGIVYGIAAGLGFASVENVVYLIRLDQPSIIVLRSFTATLGHVTASGLLGYSFGLARFTRGSRRWWLPLGGLAVAVWLHGLYDWLLTIGRGATWLALLVLLPFGLLMLGIRIRRARAVSRRFHSRLSTDGHPLT
jgi:RsiW-degrading membrane proteinase PrsW (M82 family)